VARPAEAGLKSAPFQGRFSGLGHRWIKRDTALDQTRGSHPMSKDLTLLRRAILVALMLFVAAATYAAFAADGPVLTTVGQALTLTTGDPCSGGE
jgi:hypothetical protein